MEGGGEGGADEYREIFMEGKAWTPADAARAVAQDQASHGWIPGPVQAQSSLPLSCGELSELYRTNISLSLEDEHELSGNLPELTDLPNPDDFAPILQQRNQIQSENLELISDLGQP